MNVQTSDRDEIFDVGRMAREWTTCAALAERGVDLDELRDAIKTGLVFAVPTPLAEFQGFVVSVESFERWRAGQPVKVETKQRVDRRYGPRPKQPPIEVIYPPGTVDNTEASRLTGRNVQSILEAGVSYELIKDVNGKGRYRAWSVASIEQYLARRARGERHARKDPEGRLTLREACKLAGVSEHVLRRADDELKPERVGAHRRYRREVVEAWAASRRAS